MQQGAVQQPMHQQPVQPANDMVQQMPMQGQGQEESYLVNGQTMLRSQVLLLPGMNEAMLVNLQRV